MSILDIFFRTENHTSFEPIEEDSRIQEKEKSDLLLIVLKTVVTINYLLHLIVLLAFIIGDIVAATLSILCTWIIIKWTNIFSLNNKETKSLDS